MRNSRHIERPQIITTYKHFKYPKYPIWVVLCAIGLLGYVIYSYSFMPSYLNIFNKLKLGELAYKNHNYEESIKYLEQTLELNPTSKKAKIAIAKSYFAKKNQKDDLTALEYLKGVSLSDSEWRDISEIIPKKYHEYFHAEKKQSKKWS